jgi:hypothetical protein
LGRGGPGPSASYSTARSADAAASDQQDQDEDEDEDEDSPSHPRQRSWAIPPARSRIDHSPCTGREERSGSFLTVTTDPSPPVGLGLFGAANPTPSLQEAGTAANDNNMQTGHARRRSECDADVTDC